MLGMTSVVSSANAQVLRCEIDGHVVYTNLFIHCPPMVTPSAKAAKPAVHKKVRPRTQVLKKVVAKGDRNRPKRLNKPKRIKVKSWWKLLGGPVAPEGLEIKADRQTVQLGVTIRYHSLIELLLAKKLLSPDALGLFLPQLADQPIARRSLQSLASMNIQTITVVPYQPTLFASLQRQGKTQLPVPVGMMEVAFIDSQGKRKVHEFPYGEISARLYISVPYTVHPQ